MGIEGVVDVLVAMFTGRMARGIALISLAILAMRWMGGDHAVGRATVHWAIGGALLFGGPVIIGLFI